MISFPTSGVPQRGYANQGGSARYTGESKSNFVIGRKIACAVLWTVDRSVQLRLISSWVLYLGRTQPKVTQKECEVILNLALLRLEEIARKQAAKLGDPSVHWGYLSHHVPAPDWFLVRQVPLDEDKLSPDFWGHWAGTLVVQTMYFWQTGNSVFYAGLLNEDVLPLCFHFGFCEIRGD